MPRLSPRVSPKALEAGRESLEQNEYPGRVIIQGLNSRGNAAVQAYALTGRRESSRNRAFVRDEYDQVRVVAPGLTEEEMNAVPDSRFIYYKAMTHLLGIFVVSNGAQTDPVVLRLPDNPELEAAVKDAPWDGGVNLASYELDEPNFTPRITGAIIYDWKIVRSALSIVRRHPESKQPVYTTYTAPGLKRWRPGVGFGIQTYNGNGDPLPSFDRQPYPFPLGETAEETAHVIWGVLNQDNRVAVVARTIDLGDESLDYHIINKHEVPEEAN